MTDSHNQTNINQAPEQGVTSIIFAPNADAGTNQNDGLKFTTWGAVMDTITNFPGQYEVNLDPGPIPASGAAPQVTIPPGTYDFLNRVTLVGPRQINIVNIDNVVFQNLKGARNVEFVHAGAAAIAPFESSVAGDTVTLDFDRCSFSNVTGSTGPIFRATGNGGLMSIAMVDCNVQKTSGFPAPFDAADALSGFVISSRQSIFGNSTVGDGSVFDGLGVLSISLDSNSTFWTDIQALDATGTVTISARRQTFYVAAADAAAWAAPVPTNYQDAVRRIAAVVAANHGAIPV